MLEASSHNNSSSNANAFQSSHVDSYTTRLVKRPWTIRLCSDRTARLYPGASVTKVGIGKAAMRLRAADSRRRTQCGSGNHPATHLQANDLSLREKAFSSLSHVSYLWFCGTALEDFVKMVAFLGPVPKCHNAYFAVLSRSLF